MKFYEEMCDLFTLPNAYVLCHCISSDFAMSSGIARKFADMGVKDELKARFEPGWDGRGYCLITQVDRITVANLVTKERSFQKPTMKSMREALVDFRDNWDKSARIGMPRIGCGSDKLSWEEVSRLIQRIYADTDVEIKVCIL